ncbi:hypothetical protein VMCG_04834 [Cytospora schulzeri]|uniref:RNase III domain-containing protein n=1 Tax=Cytospora schulzeri TaxID=448051 RepID=A0A423WN94_9PEZI|nr:hypothetical protein VMCG_04834 [Valsa malicola]
MASLRGWARTASTASKLASVEQIIGYNFKSVERLYEALDLEKVLTLPNGEERHGKRTRNTRLALVGDAAAQFHLASRWYNKDLEGVQWVKIRTEGLCNDTLGKIGFTMGLDELTVPTPCDEMYAMASTIEAILGAVYYDGGEKALKDVMARCGISHKLLEDPEDEWKREPVKTSRQLPGRYFSGHQWEWQSLLFRINPRVLPRDKTSRVANLPLNDARVLLEEVMNKVEIRRKTDEDIKKRKREKAKRIADMEAHKELKDASKRIERLKQRAEAEKAKKAAVKAKREAVRAKEALEKKRQQTSLWQSMKRLWLGSDGVTAASATVTGANIGSNAGSNAETPSNSAVASTAPAEPVTPAKTETPAAEESNTVAETEVTAAESNTASGSDTAAETNTSTVVSDVTNVDGSAKDSPTPEKISPEKLSPLEQFLLADETTPEKSYTADMPVLTVQERKVELLDLKTRVRSLGNQKKAHLSLKKRSRRKGGEALAAYEARMADICTRLETAKRSLEVVERMKPK